MNEMINAVKTMDEKIETIETVETTETTEVVDTMARKRAQWVKDKRNQRNAHPLRRVHGSMLQRCGVWRGSSRKDLAHYAEAGITVWPAWRDFEVFENYALAHGWKPGLTIDRVDGRRGYMPGNVRFVTRCENNRNRANTVFVWFDDKRQAAGAVWEKADQMGQTAVGYSTFVGRVRRGWDVDTALRMPALNK